MTMSDLRLEPGSCAWTPWPANRRLRCVSSQLQVHAPPAAAGVHAPRTAGAAAQTAAAGLNTGRYHALQTAQDPFYQQGPEEHLRLIQYFLMFLIRNE